MCGARPLSLLCLHAMDKENFAFTFPLGKGDDVEYRSRRKGNGLEFPHTYSSQNSFQYAQYRGTIFDISNTGCVITFHCRHTLKTTKHKHNANIISKPTNAHAYIYESVLYTPYTSYRYKIVNVKVKFTLEQATKAQRRRRGVALLFP